MTGELRGVDRELYRGAGFDLDDHPFAGLRQHRQQGRLIARLRNLPGHNHRLPISLGNLRLLPPC